MGIMNKDRTAPGWCCVDCLMLEANGETNPDWDEEQTESYLARVEEAGHWTLGRLLGQNGCECEDWDTDQHREGCERKEFSWSWCDVCGSKLGGERAAVTFWLDEDNT